MDNWLAEGAVRLEALGADDIDTAWPWFQDGTFLRQLDAAPAVPRTREQVASEWTHPRNDAVKLGVFQGEGQLVGLAGLDGILWNQGIGWVVLAVSPAYQGRGVGRSALRLLLRLGFGELNLRRLQLTVFEDNHRAVHLYESVGFRREGAFREFLERDGELTDMLLYGILRREWAEAAG
jgi:RimJ/RimL family protein N-acetyltransferase